MLLNIGGHGLGDCFLALQISYLLKERNIPHVNCISTREQVFGPLKHITNGVFELNHISEDISSDNKIVLNQELQKLVKRWLH